MSPPINAYSITIEEFRIIFTLYASSIVIIFLLTTQYRGNALIKERQVLVPIKNNPTYLYISLAVLTYLILGVYERIVFDEVHLSNTHYDSHFDYKFRLFRLILSTINSTLFLLAIPYFSHKPAFLQSRLNTDKSIEKWNKWILIACGFIAVLTITLWLWFYQENLMTSKNSETEQNFKNVNDHQRVFAIPDALYSLFSQTILGSVFIVSFKKRNLNILAWVCGFCIAGMIGYQFWLLLGSNKQLYNDLIYSMGILVHFSWFLFFVSASYSWVVEELSKPDPRTNKLHILSEKNGNYSSTWSVGYKLDDVKIMLTKTEAGLLIAFYEMLNSRFHSFLTWEQFQNLIKVEEIDCRESIIHKLNKQSNKEYINKADIFYYDDLKSLFGVHVSQDKFKIEFDDTEILLLRKNVRIAIGLEKPEATKVVDNTTEPKPESNKNFERFMPGNAIDKEIKVIEKFTTLKLVNEHEVKFYFKIQDSDLEYSEVVKLDKPNFKTLSKFILVKMFSKTIVNFGIDRKIYFPDYVSSRQFPISNLSSIEIALFTQIKDELKKGNIIFIDQNFINAKKLLFKTEDAKHQLNIDLIQLYDDASQNIRWFQEDINPIIEEYFNNKKTVDKERFNFTVGENNQPQLNWYV